MTAGLHLDWSAANQRYLLAALAQLRGRLERAAAHQAADTAVANAEAVPWPEELARQSGAPALDVVCARVGLSAFERDILLLCAGIELDAAFPRLCAAVQGDPTRSYPTFSLALAALAEPHWSALTPEAPLRYWRLIEVGIPSGATLTTAALRIDERVLHFLTGIQHLDERLAGLVAPVHLEDDLVPSQRAVAASLAGAWSRARGALPLIQICGADELSRRSIAAVGCAQLGMHLYVFDADAAPRQPGELEGIARLWEREATLAACALYIDGDAIDAPEGRPTPVLTRWLDRLRGPVLLGVQRPVSRALCRTTVTFEVGKPTSDEQRALWSAALGESGAALNGKLERLVAHFNLSARAIRASAACAQAASCPDAEALAGALWDSSRAQAHGRLDDLAQRIESVATWDDLVLPDAESELLRQITVHVAHRATVYGAWGFAAAGRRGLGISALFAGASGTGKTMAAEVLANALHLDLYRIDLSSVVSKYIGETEKNLRRVFDAAEDGGAILFFDEADALFGKRSEVKDSHDRYANIEINYLLQRMEQYRGLAILATNRKGDLDPAFLRRIRFVVNFSLPDGTQRAEIWRRVFPRGTPTDGLDVHQLARLNIAGGNIRNIALGAAFLAAAAGEPVRMTHLQAAARCEFAKLDRPVSDAKVEALA